MQFSSTLLLCVTATAYAAAEPRAQGKAKDDGIVVALFTDANSRDSRADFTVGKWDFEGCKYRLDLRPFSIRNSRALRGYWTNGRKPLGGSCSHSDRLDSSGFWCPRMNSIVN